MKFIALKKVYVFSALALLNAFILFSLLNIFLYVVFLIKDASKVIKSDLEILGKDVFFHKDGAPINNGLRRSNHLNWFDYLAYKSDGDEAYVSTVLDDFYEMAQLGLAYQPWVQFSESAYKGHYLNVELDKHGFPNRKTYQSQKTSSKEIKIITLGGSTTFGYLVSDEHTWPSYLSKLLDEEYDKENVRFEVLNFGRGHYNPSQELVLLTKLIKSGYRPDLVIFMDGVNWGPKTDVPFFTDKLAKAMEMSQFGTEVELKDVFPFKGLPIFRLIRSVKKRLSLYENSVVKKKRSPIEVDTIVDRFRENKMMSREICELYDIESFFFLQPDAVYNYSLELYRNGVPENFLERRGTRKTFYKKMREEEGYVDLTHLFEKWGNDKKAIVDLVHYSPSFNKYLAEHVAETISKSSMLKKKK